MSNIEQEILEIVDEIQFEKITEHPNILIAAGFWEEDRYRAAKVCYKFMRMIDDLIDNRKAKEEEITCMERQLLTEKVNSWINCLEDISSNDPFLRELTDTLDRFKIPLKLFHNFAISMQHDIDNNGFATFDQFLDYANGASVAPASVFMHLCCLNKKGNEYFPADFDVIEAARPCAIFSYIVHIIRDFQKDQWNNLNYFALDILEKYNLDPSHLRGIADGGPVPDAFRNMMNEYYIKAKHYEAETFTVLEKLNGQVKGRYYLSLQIIFNLYQQVFNRIDIRKGSFTKEELNPSPLEIKQNVLEVLGKS